MQGGGEGRGGGKEDGGVGGGNSMKSRLQAGWRCVCECTCREGGCDLCAEN